MTETPSERREAAATRRRWVTLAEVVAVAGVVIAALTLWNSWSERRDAAAEKAATETSAAASISSRAWRMAAAACACATTGTT